MNNQEIWKNIIVDGEENEKYQVSNYGRVKNTITGHILSSYLSDGKLKVTLVVNNGRIYDSSFSVDKLELEAFLGITFSPGYIVHYLDGDAYNLHLDNLEYITYEEYLKRIVLNVFKKQDDYYVLKDYNLHKDEKWKFIYLKDKLTNYMVSNYGHIFNIITGLYLSPSFGTHGYAFIVLRGENGKSVRMDMHRLVAKYFVYNPDPEVKTYVHHKNHNRGDFIYTNLEWVSPSENSIESIEYNSSYGENAINRKITENEARQICQMLQDGYRISQIAYAIGCKRTTVRHIKNRSSWKEVSKDYSFDNTYKSFIDSKILDSARFLLKKGLSRRQIKELLGISFTTIARIDQQGFDFILNIKSIIEMNVVIMFKKGYEISEISDILGITQSRVQNIITYYETEEMNL